MLKHRRDEGRRLRASARMAVDREPADRRPSTAALDARLLFPRVAAAIDALPDGEREALLLFAWEELSYQGVAEALELPIGTVRSRLNRARAQLRELLRPSGKTGRGRDEAGGSGEEAAARGRVRAFGFREIPDARLGGKDGVIGHALVEFGDGVIGIGTQGAHGAISPKSAGVASQYLSVTVADIEAHHQRALAAGAQIAQAVRDHRSGYRSHGARPRGAPLALHPADAMTPAP